MPKVTEEHRQARRDQILKAALECFAKKGFHKTSMKDIFDKAGLSAGAVYLQFSCKEDIIDESWNKIREARTADRKQVGEDWPQEKLSDEIFGDFKKRINRVEEDLYWQVYIQLIAEALRNPRIKQGIHENWNDARSRDLGILQRIANMENCKPDVDFDTIVHLWQAVRNGLIILKYIEPEKNVEKYLEAFEECVKNMLFDSKTIPAKLGKTKAGNGRESIKKLDVLPKS
jgi:AcrR family transcriptional regulator